MLSHYPRALFAAATLGLCLAQPAHSQTTVRSSFGLGGDDPDSGCLSPSLDDTGRFVVFRSSAANLVPGDTNNDQDVFVYDSVTQGISRVSVDSNGAESNGPSHGCMIAADARSIVFSSLGSNLVGNDTNGAEDIFVREYGLTERVNVDSSGAEANDDSYQPSLSGDGRFVAFTSTATNLFPIANTGVAQGFLRDRTLGLTRLISWNWQGSGPANDIVHEPELSYDGTVVCFYSVASDLVPGDTNGVRDVFVRDMASNVTTRVSLGLNGAQANGNCVNATISGDGRFILFDSVATNLVANDLNGESDVFIHDRMTGVTERVSLSSNEEEANDYSSSPSVSRNGRFVSFLSLANNLVGDDTNEVGDYFVRDRFLGITHRVSLTNDEGQGYDRPGGGGFLSGQGRHFAFPTLATMVPEDGNDDYDVYLRTRALPSAEEFGSGYPGTLADC